MTFQTINATGSRLEPKPILVPLPLSPWQQTRLRLATRPCKKLPR
jgi:hypothetical protein